MIRSEWRAEWTPDLTALTENSVAEVTVSGVKLEDMYLVFDDDALLVAFHVGKAQGLVGVPEIHLLVGKAYGPQYARYTKKVFDALVVQHRGFATLINVRFEKGCRFAEFLGFRPRGGLVEHAGRRLQYYEVHV